MKKSSFVLVGVILLAFCYSCIFKGDACANRIPFVINSLDRKMVLQVKFNDSTMANMIFDSGWNRLGFALDSAFYLEHPDLMATSSVVKVEAGGSAWTPEYHTKFAECTSPPTMKLGEINCIYSNFAVGNLKQIWGPLTVDGIFNIPANDSTHVWELNFEQNYIEIHSGREFVMPQDCFIFPLEEDSLYFKIKMPMHVKCASGDTLTINRSFLIDTGAAYDICLMYQTPELQFFNKQQDAVWLQFVDRYCRRYTVQTTLFDSFQMDSVRIYTFDFPNNVSDYVVGTNFLKRFNVYFDLPNRRIGLQPHKNYQRVVNPSIRRYYVGTRNDSRGLPSIVDNIADCPGNPYQEAGFRLGDMITHIDTIKTETATREALARLQDADSITYGIIRDGKPMKITVHFDRSIPQGD